MGSARTSLGLWVTVDGVPPSFESESAVARQRKGWLLLVPGVAMSAADLARAAERYYNSSRFDVEPMLFEALRVGGPAEEAGDVGWPCCGAVLAGLDLTALLPPGYGAWVAGENGLRALPAWPVHGGHEDGLGELYRCHHRMRPGETVLLGKESLGAIAGSKRLARLASHRPQRFRRRLQRIVARQGAPGQLSFAMVHYPAGPAVAIQQPWDRPAVVLPPRPAVTRGGFSPIWVALAITILSAVSVYAVKRPSLPQASLTETLTFLLTIDRLGQAGAEGESPPALGE